MKVVVRESAAQDLDQIFEWIAKYSAAADNLRAGSSPAVRTTIRAQYRHILQA